MSLAGAGAGPAILPLAPLFRGARPFLLRSRETATLSTLPIQRLTLIPSLLGEMPPRQIMLDRAILSANSWTFDAAGHVLTWESSQSGAPHEGRLQFAPDLSRAQGMLSTNHTAVAVTAELPPITYTCAIARNTGAYVTGVAPALQLRWDTTSDAWNAAQWQQNALQFTYQMKQQTIVGQSFYGFSVSFADLQTGATWSPEDGTFDCLIDEYMTYAMTLHPGMSPPPDDRSKQTGEAGQIATVFPFQIAFQLSATAIDLQGAALTVTNAQNGVTLGMNGSTANPSICGYYAQGGSESNFAVHDGTLYVAGSPVVGARILGTRLSWEGLRTEAQQASGLPVAGTLLFDIAGERFTVAETDVKGARMVGEAAEALVVHSIALRSI
jgi:hypothetical protein